MKMKQKIAIYTVVLASMLFTSACEKSTNITPTSLPPVVSTPVMMVKDLVIASTNAFVDSYGTYRVVGEVVNNSSAAFNSIELTIEIKDASGNSLLKDDSGTLTQNTTFSPMLFTLAPAEASPFDYSYDTTDGTPASYSVTISDSEAGDVNRANISIEKVQLVDDGSGWYYLTGELVNLDSQWARINSLAGAVLDDSNKVLSADRTATYTTVLAPTGDASQRDRTPFEINFPNPGGATKWHVYLDGEVHDNVIDYPMDVTVTNLAFDQYGSAHLVGWVTNNSDQALETLVVAGLYLADGTVLDSSYGFIPIPMEPGATTPFSISAFGVVDFNPDQAALVRTYSAQTDTWFTFTPSYEFIHLASSGETIQKDDGTWIFTGSVSNTSEKSLSSATVVAMLMDDQKKLIAMEYTTIYPTGDAILAGETNPYSVSVSLGPDSDSTNLTTTIFVVGYVK